MPGYQTFLLSQYEILIHYLLRPSILTRPQLHVFDRVATGKQQVFIVTSTSPQDAVLHFNNNVIAVRVGEDNLWM